MDTSLTARLEPAVRAREALFDAAHEHAFRLFNGFTEGCPDLAIDLYARTAVLFDHAEDRAAGDALVTEATAWLRARYPWLRAIVRKRRAGDAAVARIHGDDVDTRVREHGVLYAVDLALNRDASLYLDARNLRAWARTNLRDKQVLNTFAYTCSLGVAARAGGAARVVNTDRSARFLAVGRASYALNSFAARAADFRAADFFPQVSQLKRAGARFDCVFLDPPFFSTTSRGVVDLEHRATQLINKVRPLVADGGAIVAVNNGLYVSGADYLAELTALTRDGYLTLESLIPVGEDFTGTPETRAGAPVTDPAPFNHSTKIAVLRVRRRA